MPLENFIITVFCLVDGELKKKVGATRLRKRGFEPKLSDSEIITMEIVAEFLGIDTDNRLGNILTIIGRIFSRSWAHVQILRSMLLTYGILNNVSRKN